MLQEFFRALLIFAEYRKDLLARDKLESEGLLLIRGSKKESIELALEG